MPRGRPVNLERYLTADELDAAIREAKAAGESHLVQRLCFVKNCYAGDTATAAARRVGVSRSTGSRWVRRWNTAGVEGLRPNFGGGRPPKLDDEERERLRERLAADGPWTTAAVRSLVEDEFGVEYSPGYLPRLLRSLGMGYQYPGDERPGDGQHDANGDAVADGRTPIVGFFDEESG